MNKHLIGQIIRLDKTIDQMDKIIILKKGVLHVEKKVIYLGIVQIIRGKKTAALNVEKKGILQRTVLNNKML